MKSIRLIACLGLLAACSHDTQRDNPLDPVLNPLLTLSAVVDGDARQVTLGWSTFAGRGTFLKYNLRRQIIGGTERVVISLEESGCRNPSGIGNASFSICGEDIRDTVYVDGTVDNGTTYTYSVFVTTSTGERTAESNEFAVVIPARPIRLSAEFDSAESTATLSWNSIGRSYLFEVRRQTAVDRGPMIVAEALADTQYVDDGLQPDTEYEYLVIGRSSSGSVVRSQPVSGSL